MTTAHKWKCDRKTVTSGAISISISKKTSENSVDSAWVRRQVFSPAARLQNKGGSGYLAGRVHLLKKQQETKTMGFDGLVLPELQLLSLQKRLMNGDQTGWWVPMEMAPINEQPEHPTPAPSSSRIRNESGKRTHIRARSVSGSPVVRVHLGFFLLSP